MIKIVTYNSEFEIPSQVIHQHGKTFDVLHLWRPDIPKFIESLDKEIHQNLDTLAKEGLGDDTYFDYFPDKVFVRLQLEAWNLCYSGKSRTEQEEAYHKFNQALQQEIIRADKAYHKYFGESYEDDSERLEDFCDKDLLYEEALYYFENHKEEFEAESMVCENDQELWHTVKTHCDNILNQMPPHNDQEPYKYALESEEESLPIDHLYTLIFTAILLNQKELLIAVFEDLNEVKLEKDAPDYNEDRETWEYIHTKGQEFRINNTQVIFYYS